MMKKLTVLCALALWGFGEVLAQRPQFSQYYAAPLYINPALAGSDEKARFILNYRNQWPSLQANFTTYSASFDMYVDRIKSGFGVVYAGDFVPNAGYSSQDIGLQYSYELQMNNKWTLRAGMQGSYTMRNYAFSKLTFGDQYRDDIGFTGNPTFEQFGGALHSQINVSAGGFLYSEKMWLGVAAHGLNRPRQDVLPSSTASNTPIHYSVQGGMNIPLKKGVTWRDKQRGAKDVLLIPTFLYKHQGKFDQLDLGAYFKVSPLVFGMWYRGIPIKPYEIGLGNNESLVALLGVEWDNLSVGYSYDYTISSLGARTGGAHELSLRVLMNSPERGRGRKTSYRNNFPCPKF